MASRLLRRKISVAKKHSFVEHSAEVPAAVLTDEKESIWSHYVNPLVARARITFYRVRHSADWLLKTARQLRGSRQAATKA